MPESARSATPQEGSFKRRKKEPKKPIPNQCEFFMKNKGRRCAMQRKKDHKFCSEHILHDTTDAAAEVKSERVPCPLDPKHSVWAKDLEKHMAKCPGREVEEHDAWYEKNANTELTGYKNAETFVEEELSEKELFDKYIAKLREYAVTVEPLEMRSEMHPGLTERLGGKETKRHIAQQSSLIGNMKASGLLGCDKFYVEFGCGKGDLSRSVNACVLHDTKNNSKDPEIANCADVYGFGLIDRGVNRMKADNRIVNDCGQILQPIIKRSRIDIEHLNLDKFLQDLDPAHVVGISKHLCGAATDLTLKLILNSKRTMHNFEGMVVAMCCRHACDYKQLLPQSREFLAEYGFESAAAFSTLKKIVTWAVCGRKEGQQEQHISGLQYEEREELGLAARRLIDESRVRAVREHMPQHKVQLFRYIDTATTLENHCLSIHRVQ